MVGVKKGCIFTGFVGQRFGPEGIVLEAPLEDAWTVFANSPQTARFDEEIESLTCLCA